MKLTILFIFLTTFLFGQLKTPSQRKVDSLALANLNLRLDQLALNNQMLTLRASNWVKLTVKTGINTSYNTRVLTTSTTNDFSDVDDYLSLGYYDIRGKIYLHKNHRIGLVNRMVLNGVNSKKYGYYSGFVIKFK